MAICEAHPVNSQRCMTHALKRVLWTPLQLSHKRLFGPGQGMSKRTSQTSRLLCMKSLIFQSAWCLHSCRIGQQNTDIRVRLYCPASHFRMSEVPPVVLTGQGFTEQPETNVQIHQRNITRDQTRCFFSNIYIYILLYIIYYIIYIYIYLYIYI